MFSYLNFMLSRALESVPWAVAEAGHLLVGLPFWGSRQRSGLEGGATQGPLELSRGLVL